MRNLRWGMGAIGALVATGVVALSVVSFSGAASAQTPKDDARTRHQELLAQELGISVDRLTEAQKAVRDKLVDEAVAAGKLTPEQGAKIKSGELSHLRMEFGERMKHGAKAIVTSVFEAAAKVIGIDEPTLKTELSSGKTLAEVAASHGVSRDQLESGMTTQLKADIASALAAGTINQQQADRLTQALEQRIDAVIDGTAREHLKDMRQGGPFGNGEGMRDGGPMGGRFFRN